MRTASNGQRGHLTFSEVDVYYYFYLLRGAYMDVCRVNM